MPPGIYHFHRKKKQEKEERKLPAASYKDKMMGEFMPFIPTNKPLVKADEFLR
jgi:hypothetical protein